MDANRAFVQIQVIKATWKPVGKEPEDFDSFYSIAKSFAEYWNDTPEAEKTVSGAIEYVRRSHLEILTHKADGK